MLSESEFAQKIKTKYPEYAKVPDAILVQKIIEKHPGYKDQVETSFIGRLAGATQDQAPEVVSKGAVLAQGQQEGTIEAPLTEKVRSALVPDVTGSKTLDTLISPVTAPAMAIKEVVTAPGEAVKAAGEEALTGLTNIGVGLGEQAKEMVGADTNKQVSGEGFSQAWNGLVQTLSAPMVGASTQIPGGDKVMQAIGAVFNAPASALGYVYDKVLEEKGYDPTKPEFQMAKQQLMDAVNVGLMAKGPEIAKGTSKALSIMDKGFTKGIYWLEDTLKKSDLPPEVKTTVTKSVQQNINGLSQIENNNKSIRTFTQDAQSKGIDVKEMVGQSDLLLDSVDSDGTIRTTKTGGAVDQVNQLMEPAEGVVTKNLIAENKSIPFKDVEAYMKAQIENGDFAGAGVDKALAAMDAELQGLAKYVDADGNIKLSDLQKLKIYKNKTINYMNPEVGMTDKTIVRAIKELIEQNTDSIDVKAINKELQALYTVKEFLTLLDGKKVKGGKLGKYFAQTVGTVVGSSFGPIGAILGGELAKYIQGKQMQGTFKSPTGSELGLSEQMQVAIDQSSKKDGSLNTSQSTTISPVK